MAQAQEQILPVFLQTDNAIERLKPNEGVFIKGLGFDQNGNPSEEAGTGEGYNSLVQTPTRSNQLLANLPSNLLPAGVNKNCGAFESIETNELYWANWNSNGNHGIYVYNSDTGQISTVIVDTNLPFTDDQHHFLNEHRWTIRFVKETDGHIIAKFLLFTNGAGWQGWINVEAAIATSGFNAQLFPYYQLTPPHFDRRELIEWAIRPCMYAPKVATIPNGPNDLTKVNRLIDTAFQVAIIRRNTDGRVAKASPYSLPLIIKSEDYLNNPDNLSKNALFTLDAGSCMTEAIDIFIRKNVSVQNQTSILTWSDWYKYDTVYKFGQSQTSEGEVLSTPYWLRTNPWASYSYDPVHNTIQYTFDNSRVLQAVDQADFGLLQNDIPQRSKGLTDAGDSALLINNLRDYDNLPSSVLQNLGAQVATKPQVGCKTATRTIDLYAFVGMSSMGIASGFFTGISQVGYVNGADTTVRFGGLTYGSNTTASIDFNISKTFDLNFSDKQAFRAYLKGTPYYADGQWYQVNSDFSMVLISDLLDFSNQDVLAYVRNVYLSGGYFVCKFTFTVPAGRYIATIGRHNVATSGDYRNTSTYIVGLANSRTTISEGGGIVTLSTTAVVSYSKEMEIDCTSGNVDVWGNGKDLFYIFCPSIFPGAFRFIEGYWEESPDSPLGVELYSYTAEGNSVALISYGRYTDKNGFYFAYVWGDHSGVTDVHIIGNINCSQQDIDIKTAGGIGWRQNPTAYLSDHNSGSVGDCNRVLYKGKVTSLDGTIGYSNIAISIVDGQTVLSDENGNFTLIIHNGSSIPRISNVYVNSGGNFLINTSGCGFFPLTQYNEFLIPCHNCLVRNYPIPLTVAILIQNTSQTSAKQGGKYAIGGLLGDLAGRVSFVNLATYIPVPSFLERDNTLATFLQLLILGQLKLNLANSEYKWFAPAVSKNLNEKTYTEWVGDYIEYIDNNGNVVSDPASAVYVSIGITSLYNYNSGKNFSTLASYQFAPGDRIRILDDGQGDLLTGNPIDLKVLGQNYNQAAQTAGLIPSTSNVPVVNNNLSNNTQSTTSVTDGAGTTTTTVSLKTVQNNENIALFVLYDPRLTPLINAKGFWIEIYTPADQSTILAFAETQGFLPVINGEIAEFTGISNGVPTYNFPSKIDITFWDTYLFPRNITIPNVGDKFFDHPFESPNISDSFGSLLDSGGRQSFNNNLARQQWYMDEVGKSDDFVTTGSLNGIGTFRSANRKVFKDFKSGQLLVAKSVRNNVFFLCENDWFVTDYNFQYIYANAQGVQIANLDNNLGSPHQKIGSNFGMLEEDIGSLVAHDDFISWFDRKNQAWVFCDYRTANDISTFDANKGIAGGMSSYIDAKAKAISSWNKTAPNSSRFDVVGGIDMDRYNLFLTFRPRRNNSNDPSSYGSSRKNMDLLHQETLTYNAITKRFVRFENFTPEAYGKMRGKVSGVQLVAFAAGLPYLHNTGNTSFNNFFGVQYDAVIMGAINHNQEVNKIFANLCLDVNGPGLYADFMRTNDPNSFSYLPMNLVTKAENKYRLTLRRNMNSYPAPTPDNTYRGTYLDGKRMYNLYLLFRLISDPGARGQYFEIKTIYSLFSDSTNEKK